MNRAAVIAALPGELKPFVRGWSRGRRAGVRLWRGSVRDIPVVAACGGMGAAGAARTLAVVEREGPHDLVISAGWAGALSPGFPVGSAHAAAGVIDAVTGQRFPAVGSDDGAWVVTAPAVADAAEKKRLAAVFGAALVDMEAAIVARWAEARGLRFACVKAVSDGPGDPLQGIDRAISAEGRFLWSAFLLYALPRPRHWPALARLGRNSGQAARALRSALNRLLDEQTPIGTPGGN